MRRHPHFLSAAYTVGAAIARGPDRLVDVYDHGDNWRHDVIVEEVRDGDPDLEYPAFVDGGPALSAGGCRRAGRLHGFSGGDR